MGARLNCQRTQDFRRKFVSGKKMDQKLKKATKNQEATRKYHVYSIVPCFAPHAASKTLCSFLPFSCVTNLLETLELGEVFFPRFYVDYAVPTEEHLGSTADAVTNLVSPRSVGKRGRSSAEVNEARLWDALGEFSLWHRVSLSKVSMM